MNAPAASLRPIEIIGGGLAGLSLGVALRQRNVPVTLHEAAGYPRHRVCGEFITGLAASTRERLDLGPVLVDALQHHEVAWHVGASEPRVQHLPQAALGISRHRLDERLATKFVGLGGVLREHSRVAEPDRVAGRVVATGRRPHVGSPWIGLKVHARDLPLRRDLEMHLGDQSYVGLARVEGEVVNVCGLFRRRAIAERGPDLLLAYLDDAGLHALGERLRAATLDAASFCAVAGLGFDVRFRAQDRLGIGDAAATIPPFTGNGMAMAFQSAEAALEPLLAYAGGARTWAETVRATNVALRGRFRFRLVSATVLHRFLLQPRPQRWFATLSRARLVPFRPLYASLH